MGSPRRLGDSEVGGLPVDFEGEAATVRSAAHGSEVPLLLDSVWRRLWGVGRGGPRLTLSKSPSVCRLNLSLKLYRQKDIEWSSRRRRLRIFDEDKKRGCCGSDGLKALGRI